STIHLLDIADRFPYTTLFRSDAAGADAIKVAEVEIVVEEHLGDGAGRAGIDLGLEHVDVGVEVAALGVLLRIGTPRAATSTPTRSEEQTSELQSHFNLVRLLL